MRKRGRRTKLTPSTQASIVQALQTGVRAIHAAEVSGISERTFYRWLARGEEQEAGVFREFYQAVLQARGSKTPFFPFFPPDPLVIKTRWGPAAPGIEADKYPRS